MPKKSIRTFLPQRATTLRVKVVSKPEDTPPNTFGERIANRVQALRKDEPWKVRTSVSGKIDLPNGQSITTVRKDVMDRALGRGEFKNK